jgi:dihydrolipoamide dehydrogenase
MSGCTTVAPRIAVLGGGPGGYVAALRAAQRGAAVTLVEKDLIGGTCLNRGCIPTKAFLASAEALARARAGEEYGFTVTGEVRPDLARIVERKERIVTQLRDSVKVLLRKAHVQVIQGRGRLRSAGALLVDTGSGTVTVEADRIIIATGSEPAHLPLFDFTQPTVLTSTSVLGLRQIPASLLIVGAGSIGCEFAAFFAELGTKVTLVEMMDQILPLEDRRLAKQFQNAYRKRGIQVLVKTRVEAIEEYAADRVVARLSNGSQVAVEKILVSAGREPNTGDIGLEDVGVETDSRGYVVTNDYLETSIPHVYSIGDVNGGLMLAHVASYEALVAVDNCLGGRHMCDLAVVPSCTYSSPEVASVGLSEEQATERGYEPVTGTYRFAALGKALALGEDTGYVQLVVDKKSDLVLGANMLGPHVTDIIHEVALAVRNRLTARQLADTIYAHPTLAEAVMEAAHDVHNESVHTVSR